MRGWIATTQRALDAGLPVPPLARFRRDADWIGVQRHLKVIGIFARLWHRDGKPKYLADVPRFFAYLDARRCRSIEELAPLPRLIERTIKPRWRRGPRREPPIRKALILAAGLGERMRPLTDTTPEAAAARRRQAADRMAPGKTRGARRARGRGQHVVAGRAVPAGARRRRALGHAPALLVRRRDAAGNRRRHVERTAAARRQRPSSPSTATSGPTTTSRACRTNPTAMRTWCWSTTRRSIRSGDFALARRTRRIRWRRND